MTNQHADRSCSPAGNHRTNRMFFTVLTSVILGAAVVMMATTAAGLWDGNVHTKKGISALKEKNVIEAIRQFSRAQQLCETDIFAHQQLGAAYLRYGWHDEALHEFEKVWNLSQDLGFRAMVDAGRIWRDRGDMEKAVRSFERALALDPGHAPVWYELGDVHLSFDNEQKAGECFSRAVKLDPENLKYRRDLLALAIRQNQGLTGNSSNVNHGRQE